MEVFPLKSITEEHSASKFSLLSFMHIVKEYLGIHYHWHKTSSIKLTVCKACFAVRCV